MEYREIVSVTGIGGLFQLIATKNDGAIVRNLTDKNTKFIPARLHNVTPLESIEVYTTGENVRLHEVFQMMKDQPEKSLPDTKKADNDTIKGYFKSIFPEFDDERVYVSDMKKMLKWYELLKENDLLHFESMEEKGEESEDEDKAEETKEEKTATKDEKTSGEKPVKKAKAKKAATEEHDEDGEEKPKKVARKKKVAEEKDATEEKPAKKTAKKKE